MRWAAYRALDAARSGQFFAECSPSGPVGSATCGLYSAIIGRGTAAYRSAAQLTLGFFSERRQVDPKPDARLEQPDVQDCIAAFTHEMTEILASDRSSQGFPDQEPNNARGGTAQFRNAELAILIADCEKAFRAVAATPACRHPMSLTAPDVRCRLYRSFAPLHTAYTGTQLHYALQFVRTHPNTRLITISIGANDVFQCQETPSCHVQVAAARAVANLSIILKRLRTDGHYQGTIVTLTYHYTPDFPISVVKPWNATLAAATRRHGGEVANGLAAFRTASRRHGGDPCQARLLIALRASRG